MIKKLEQILIILLTIMLIISVVELNFSLAAEASISVSSAKVNEAFTVTVVIPSDAVAYEGEILVTFSDSATVSSGSLVNVTGINGDFTHPGNMTASFTASSSGSAKIVVNNLIISNKNNEQINSNTTLEQTITVEAGTVGDTSSGSSTTSNEPTWTETGDTVYALEKLNVRSGYGTSYSKIGTLAKNAVTTRIAVGSNGWDKISYNGTTGYVVSKYLTTIKPEEEPSWSQTGDIVFALSSVNVRSGWNTSYSVIGSLSKNDSVTRIAAGSNGWDKISYNGSTAYVMSKYLTTEEPEDAENTILNEVANNVVENEVVNEGDIYNQLIDEIGVIPPVGKNFVDYVYIGVVCVSIGLVSFIGMKNRENEEE